MHPIATICLEIMQVKTARELRELMGAAALAQNFAAISALVDPNKRFTEGHMKLHANNLAMLVGAEEKEFPLVVQGLLDKLKKKKSISEDDARKILAGIRKATTSI
jgi:hydroxymethylglutaryl-CoA reductase